MVSAQSRRSSAIVFMEPWRHFSYDMRNGTIDWIIKLISSSQSCLKVVYQLIYNNWFFTYRLACTRSPSDNIITLKLIKISQENDTYSRLIGLIFIISFYATTHIQQQSLSDIHINQIYCSDLFHSQYQGVSQHFLYGKQATTEPLRRSSTDLSPNKDK